MLVFDMLTSFAARGVVLGAPTPWLGRLERIDLGAFLLWVVVLAAALWRVGRRSASSPGNAASRHWRRGRSDSRSPANPRHQGHPFASGAPMIRWWLLLVAAMATGCLVPVAEGGDDAGSVDAGQADGGSPDAGALCTSDVDCNESMFMQALEGRCVGGRCVCNANYIVSPVTGKCRLDGYCTTTRRSVDEGRRLGRSAL